MEKLSWLIAGARFMHVASMKKIQCHIRGMCTMLYQLTPHWFRHSLPKHFTVMQQARSETIILHTRAASRAY